MARPTDLPIYQPAYELLQLLAKLTRQFGRDYRQVMGRGIFAEAQELVLDVVRANGVIGAAKAPHIESLMRHLETLRLSLRLAKDLHLIAAGPFGDTVRLTDAIGKQASGWLTYSRDCA